LTYPYTWKSSSWPSFKTDHYVRCSTAFDAYSRAVEWELKHWIVGHYEDICNFALHALGFNSDLKRQTPYPSKDNYLSVYFTISTETADTAYSPLQFRHFQVEPREDVELRNHYTQLKYLPDPWPGAHQYVEQAQTEGRAIITLVLSCDPVAYKVLVPVPISKTLAGWITTPTI
jgi:hypothetical protein